MAVKRWTPGRTWLMLGIVLGNLFPDLDNLAVAAATATGGSTEGLHRTFTHSLFTVALFVVAGYGVARATKQPRWGNLGLGLGIGTLMHIVLDLVIWFDGVEILWPIPSWVNLWATVTPPEWWSELMMPAEFLSFAALFWLLLTLARRRGTDEGNRRLLRTWIGVQVGLFAIFAVLVYTMGSGFMTPYGAVYLLSLGLALGVTIRMRGTIEAVA
jgi:membrane-bound metal-dependent hydrolase YbcI (DUF457 family)